MRVSYPNPGNCDKEIRSAASNNARFFPNGEFMISQFRVEMTVAGKMDEFNIWAAKNCPTWKNIEEEKEKFLEDALQASGIVERLSSFRWKLKEAGSCC